MPKRTVDEIKAILLTHKSILEGKFKVSNIGIFGSFIKGKENDKSDIDILVEFYEPIGWEFVNLQQYLEDILELKVDLVTKNSLKKIIRDNVLKEVEFV